LVNVEIEVDLRAHWRTMRDQGARSSCLACAATDAHSHSHGLDEALSVEFLFYQAGRRMPNGDVKAGLTFQTVDEALQTDGQPMETEWPYQAVPPAPWTPPTVTKRWYGALTDPGAAATDIGTVLRTRIPVILGIRLTAEFLSPIRAPYILPAHGPGFGGHAVLAVGLGRTKTNGTFILIRNSWGDGWAWEGHAWLQPTYLDDKLIAYRTLTPLPTTYP
jgi:C1A family cysteine protease